MWLFGSFDLAPTAARYCSPWHARCAGKTRWKNRNNFLGSLGVSTSLFPLLHLWLWTHDMPQMGCAMMKILQIWHLMRWPFWRWLPEHWEGRCLSAHQPYAVEESFRRTGLFQWTNRANWFDESQRMIPVIRLRRFLSDFWTSCRWYARWFGFGLFPSILSGHRFYQGRNSLNLENSKFWNF